jgi:competence protein ComEA
LYARTSEKTFADQPDLGGAGENARRLVLQFARILASQHPAQTTALQLDSTDSIDADYKAKRRLNPMKHTSIAKFAVIPIACAFVISAVVATQGQTAPQKSATRAKTGTKALIDLNKASAEELEAELPGVGPATAKKIVAGRPYTKFEDLAKAGISRRVLDQIQDLVTVGGQADAAAKTTRTKASRSKGAMAKGAAGDADAAPRATGKVNLNTADAATLEALPGIGPTTAKAIIDGRPWKSVDELDKIRGLGPNRIAALRELVTFGDEPSATAGKRSTARSTASSATAAKTSVKSQPGQKVDINTASKDELDTLPGIGPVKAQAIIDARPFKTIEDIMKVKGIKEGEFSKIKDLISVK